jgi:hypothetical protein
MHGRRLARTQEAEAVCGLRCAHNRSIDQSACLFDCPVFEVRIFSDGRVCHSGATFEHTGSTHEFRIDRRGLTKIVQALRDAILMRCAIAALAPPVIS